MCIMCIEICDGKSVLRLDHGEMASNVGQYSSNILHNILIQVMAFFFPFLSFRLFHNPNFTILTIPAKGIRRRRQFSQHFIPQWMHHQSKEKIRRGAAVMKFQRLMREKNRLERRKYYRLVFQIPVLNSHIWWATQWLWVMVGEKQLAVEVVVDPLQSLCTNIRKL